MILAADIGGTNTRLALFEGSPANLALMALEVYSSPAHHGPEEILRKFTAKHNRRVEAAGLGIAGPVVNGRRETPNLPWVVESAAVARTLGIAPISPLNDLEVNAHGIAALGEGHFAVLSAGRMRTETAPSSRPAPVWEKPA